jgi:hypothetical protein
VIVSNKALAAGDLAVAAEVSDVLERRGALKHPPVTLAVSDATALGIAGLFRSPTAPGRVMERFYRKGAVDSTGLLQAARSEQQFTSPEGPAALYCLIGWVHSKVHARIDD